MTPDDRRIDPERETKSISAETTFAADLTRPADLEAHLWRLTEKLARRLKEHELSAGGVVLKLKTKEFLSLTRSLTSATPPSSYEELAGIALSLRERVELGPAQLFRLVGVGLSNFQSDEEEPSPLFEATASDDAIDMTL